MVSWFLVSWFQGFIQIGIAIGIAIGIVHVFVYVDPRPATFDPRRLFACEAAVSGKPPYRRAGMPAFPTPQVAGRQSRVNGRDERLLVRAAFHAAAFERRTPNAELRTSK